MKFHYEASLAQRETIDANEPDALRHRCAFSIRSAAQVGATSVQVKCLQDKAHELAVALEEAGYIVQESLVFEGLVTLRISWM